MPRIRAKETGCKDIKIREKYPEEVAREKDKKRRKERRRKANKKRKKAEARIMIRKALAEDKALTRTKSKTPDRVYKKEKEGGNKSPEDNNTRPLKGAHKWSKKTR